MTSNEKVKTIGWHIKYSQLESNGVYFTELHLTFYLTMFFPYIERFGLLLLRFLNADLSTYETAYKDFFYAYGFEILKDIDEDYKFELKGKYEDEVYEWLQENK